jgi:hypothetical protein
MSLEQSFKHWRSMQYIDVTVGFCHPVERMPNSEIVIGDSFKDHTAFPNAAFVHSLPSKWAILLSPMLPSIPGNPLAAFYARIRAVSSSFGICRSVGPNTTTTARQNLKTLSVDVVLDMRR